MNKLEGFRKSLAFLIAIDDYCNVAQLQTPVADARALAELLRDQHGFETEVIADEEATLDGLRAFLEGLPVRVDKDDRVVFYFAGHGVTMGGAGGPKGYLLPQDAEPGSNARYLPMLELSDGLSALPCRHMFIILDCCFAGALRWDSTRDLAIRPEELHQERYEWFIREPAWQAIASAAHDQRALDIADGLPIGKREIEERHSPFARALLEGLSGAADRAATGKSGDGVITATELFLYLEEALRPPPGSGRRPQTPLLWPMKKHDKGQFVFLAPGASPNLPPAPRLDEQANPWRGLKPYDKQHKELFFGRSKASEALRSRVAGKETADAKPPEQFVAVLGPSGSGKSSLVRAGLLPLLPATFRPIVVRPGPRPFASLAHALRKSGVPRKQGVSRPLVNEIELATNPDALADWVEERENSRIILLVIDQAEELITMSPAQPSDLPPSKSWFGRRLELARRIFKRLRSSIRLKPPAPPDAAPAKKLPQGADVCDAYLRLLSAAMDRRPDLHVLLTVRSEFDSRFAESPLASRWGAGRYFIPEMTHDQLRRVILGPAAVKVMRFENEDLVDRLVTEVAQAPGAVALLSFALSEMYRNYLKRYSDDRTLTDADYKALQGGVAGALQIRANEVVDGVDAAHQATARRVLERLVSLETGELTRRRVRRNEFETDDALENERVGNIMQRLQESVLIVANEVGGEPHVELAHSLLLEWKRLRTWIDEDSSDIHALRRLTVAADDWDSGAGVVWDKPAQLETIKRLRDAPYPGLNRVEKSFVKASFFWARLKRAAALGLLALAAAAAYWQHSVTKAARDMALLQESRLLSRLAEDSTWEELPAIGSLLAMLALPDQDEGTARPLEPHAAHALHNALLRQREVFHVKPEEAASRLSVRLIHGGKTVAALNGKNALLRFDRETGEKAEPVKGTGKKASAVQWSPDQTKLAALSSYGDKGETGLHIWDVENGREIFWKPVPLSSTASAVFSKDGGLVAVTEGTNRTLLYDVKSGDALAPLMDPSADGFVSAAFNPDASLIALGTAYGEVQIWDWRNGQKLKTLRKQGRRIEQLFFIKNGAAVAAASPDGTAGVWDWKENEELSPFIGFGENVTSAAVSNDGKYLVAGFENGSAQRWSLETQAMLAPLLSHSRAVVSVAFSPDDARIVTASEDRTACLWDGGAGELLDVLRGHSAPLTMAHFDTAGDWIVTADHETIRVWKARNQLETQTVKAHGAAALDIAFSPDGARWASVSADATAKLWSSASPKSIATLQHQGQVAAAAFSKDGRELITVSENGVVQHWNGETGARNYEAFQSAGDSKSLMKLSAWGKRLLTVSNRTGTASLLEVESGREMLLLKSPAGNPYLEKVGDAEFSADENVLATIPVVEGEPDKTGKRRQTPAAEVLLWSAGKGMHMKTLRSGGDPIVKMALSSDGGRLVTVSEKGALYFWGADAKALPLKFGLPSGAKPAAAFSPSGKRVAAFSGSKGRMWDAASGQELLELDSTEAKGEVRQIQFIDDGQFITVHEGGFCKWSEAAAGPACYAAGRNRKISSAEMTPDRTRLAVAFEDGAFQIWPLVLDVPKMLREAKRIAPRCLTAPERLQRHLDDAVPPLWCFTGPGNETERDIAKWRGKWPFHTEDWKNWRKQVDMGRKPPRPPTL